MADILSAKKRSWLMAQVKGTNTRPEKAVRSFLHKLGYRFRIHNKSLPGSPDIVLRKYMTVIFVNGCFWHQHKNCARSRPPKSNAQFWTNKFVQNIARDIRNKRALRKQGWRVIVVWECSIERKKNTQKTLEKVAAMLVSTENSGYA
jgi:DNA mismatch endonuclease (patch repair protein)